MPALISDGYFSMKRGLEAQNFFSLFIGNYEKINFFCFFKMFLGDLEGASTSCPPPALKIHSKALLGFSNVCRQAMMSRKIFGSAKSKNF